MSAAERRRGAAAEVKVVNYLRANGYPDARRYLAGDGRQPGDIDAIPGVCIEVKDWADSRWPTWRQQALTEAGPDRIPVVVRRTRGVTDVGQWECDVLPRYWLDLSWADLPGIAVVCPRTGRYWCRIPFAQLIEHLREDSNATN